MAKRRIPLKPNELRDQMMLAAAGIAGEANWPTTAPTQLEVTTQTNSLFGAITNVANARAQLTQARSDLRDQGVDIMQQIDAVTDGLYGPDGVEKNNFGLPPKKSTGTSVPLDQAVITEIADGTSPASIAIDWETEAGAAAYQIEWFLDSALTDQVGNMAVSESEYEIGGLVAGQQYWVRAIRGSEFGAWSEPATRVANI